ncbi:MAG: AlpA family phage regulatory protein [Gammaproteobacteria bacterium]
MNEDILRFPSVRKVTGLSRSTIWRLENRGQFPARRQLSPGSVGWLRREIEVWVKTRAVVKEPQEKNEGCCDETSH